MLTAAARMYAPAPLWEGKLVHVTFHDWVYLISRAAEIKHHWPLEDPSMAGSPLSYHYFFMVHLAAASWVTNLGIPLVMLRLATVPLGVALLMQAFVLGRTVGASVWTGVLAVFLLLATGEVTLRASTEGGWFQSLFIQWLYISPTFYFGMIFMGALLLWIHRILGAPKMIPRDYGMLLFLAAAATGAKGTSVGPLAVASGMLCIWQLAIERRWPWRAFLTGGLLTSGFVVAYALVLHEWSGVGTRISFLPYTRISAFWLAHMKHWQLWLEGIGMSDGLSSLLAQLGCALVVFVGVHGVLLLGLVHPFCTRDNDKQNQTLWLGLVALACILFGHLLYLDSHGETYLYFPARLPLAVLTAVAMVGLARKLCACYDHLSEVRSRYLRKLGVWVTVLAIGLLLLVGVLSFWQAIGLAMVTLLLLAPKHRSDRKGVAQHESGGFGRFVWHLSPFLLLMGVFALQMMNFMLANRSGLKLWHVFAATGRTSGLAELHAGMDWIRHNLPADSVLVANSFTPDTAGVGHLAVLDRTTLNKHYYYSALSERRLFVEGPAYLRNQKEAKARMRIVQAISAGGPPLETAVLQRPHCYFLVDRALARTQAMIPATAVPLFENKRIALYKLDALEKRPAGTVR